MFSNHLENQISLSDELFEKFATYTYKTCGIIIHPNKKTSLNNRLRKRLKALELNNYHDYWNYLQNTTTGLSEINFFFDAISTHETFFQRGTDHYQVLRQHIIPTLLKANAKNIKIWSAGCASGEETYDINMTMLDLKEIFPKLSYSILATDLSEKQIEIAKKGCYKNRSIERLQKYHCKKYFTETEDKRNKKELIAKDSLKKNIVFKQHNLLTDLFPKDYDIIFCRNVLIYFNEQTQKMVIEKFYHSLKPFSSLFLGHSESLQILYSDFEFKNFPEGSVYIKKG